MPLYEYECDACTHRFERIQKYSDPLVDVCPKCGGTVRKLLSSPAIQFKGSGFYITDYAKKSGQVESSSSKSDGGDKDSGEKKGDKKSERNEKSDKSEGSDKSSKSSDSSESKPAATPSKTDS